MRSLLFAALLPLGLVGCVADALPTGPFSDRHPADPGRETRRNPSATVVGDYVHRDPVDPKPWRLLNDRQAPGGGGS